ncbi:MAG: J domain-containing protein [Acidimicrobiia bacterium]
MILAELNIRHTRRHMPTRRVALDASYLPMNGSAHGAALLMAVVAENILGLDDEQRELLPKFMKSAADGFNVPRIGLRYRLQTDVHGLDLSRHRLLEDSGMLVVELDVHGAPAPQVIGSIMAAAAMGATTRRKALLGIEAAIAQPGVIPEPLLVRRLLHGVPSERPPLAAAGPVGPINGVTLPDAARWAGIPSERRWAMEVLGLGADMTVDRVDVQKRFRRLIRTAHPDHGGAPVGAAERIAELTEARELLLEGLAKPAPAPS